MANVIEEYTHKLWELISRGYTLMQVASKMGFTDMNSPALEALDVDVRAFLVRFIVAWDLDLIGLDPKLAEKVNIDKPREAVVRKPPRDKAFKNKLTNAFK